MLDHAAVLAADDDAGSGGEDALQESRTGATVGDDEDVGEVGTVARRLGHRVGAQSVELVGQPGGAGALRLPVGSHLGQPLAGHVTFVARALQARRVRPTAQPEASRQPTGDTAGTVQQS